MGGMRGHSQQDEKACAVAKVEVFKNSEHVPLLAERSLSQMPLSHCTIYYKSSTYHRHCMLMSVPVLVPPFATGPACCVYPQFLLPQTSASEFGPGTQYSGAVPW